MDTFLLHNKEGEAEVNTGTSKRNTNDGERSWWRSWSNINDKNGQNISWTQPNKHCFGSLAKWVLKKNNSCVDCWCKNVGYAQTRRQSYLFLVAILFVFLGQSFLFFGGNEYLFLVAILFVLGATGAVNIDGQGLNEFLMNGKKAKNAVWKF